MIPTIRFYYWKKYSLNTFPKDEATKSLWKFLKKFSRLVLSLRERRLYFSFGWGWTSWPPKHCKKKALGINLKKKMKKNKKKNKNHLRGAWRDRCFPEPFSCFLHETSLESLKIISARCFLLKCQRKDSKQAKEHLQFRGVFGRWRTAAIRTVQLFMLVSGVEKPPFRRFFLGFGVSFSE